MNLEDYIKDLSPELQERARACSSAAELLELAREAKMPVPDEALEAIAGGADADSDGCDSGKCPKCKSKNITCYKEEITVAHSFYWRCNDCGYEWVHNYAC